METDVDVEIQKQDFHIDLQNACWRFAQFPQGPAAIKTNPQGWANSNDQSGPNQVDKTRIQNRSAATETDIVTFEDKFHVRLPSIVRKYFCELNGTSEGKLGMDDEHLIGFWHLDQVQPMKEECPQYVTDDEPHLFMFADYSIWALGYAIRLATADDAKTAIFLIGGHKPLQIAPTFEEFLKRYAHRDQGMLFGKSPQHMR